MATQDGRPEPIVASAVQQVDEADGRKILVCCRGDLPPLILVVTIANLINLTNYRGKTIQFMKLKRNTRELLRKSLK
jgi:hypothetical protein